MSGLANLVFPDLGNPDRATIALTLAGFDLSKSTDPSDHLGRFRGSWFEKDESDDSLVCAFYTRNGGGNRECIHSQGGYPYDSPECAHTVVAVVEHDFTQIEKGAPIPEGYEEQKNIMSSVTYIRSIEKVKVMKHICQNPSSIDCTCYACIIEHRLPAMDSYIGDFDDGFDPTYATIHMKAKRDIWPDGYDIALLEASVEKVDMSQRWREAIESLPQS